MKAMDWGESLVFIIGAQKAGTTTLARLLAQNSDIGVSEPKEPNYFSVNYKNGNDWYRSCFQKDAKVYLDASTTYAMRPLTEKALKLKPGRHRLMGVAERIASDVLNTKIIYLIRDPVSRMYSNYWHNKKFGYEKREFAEAVVEDPMYIQVSQYFEQLKYYLEYFPKCDFMVLKFEDFVGSQAEFVRKCEEFLGVNPQEIDASIHENSGRSFGKFGRAMVRSQIARKIAASLPKPVVQASKKLISSPIPQLSSSSRIELKEHFISDQRKLRSEFEISYSDYL